MTAQVDGRAITDPENAQNFSHTEIKQAADQMNPDGLDGALDAWSAIAAAVAEAGQQFETAIRQAVEQHWAGAAADRAVRGMREYAARVAELGESLDQQSTPLSAAANAARRFKVAVPPVLDASKNPESRNSQEEQARDDMSTLYIQPYGNTALSIPTLPPPVDPISGALGVAGAGSLGRSGDSSGGGGDSGRGVKTGTAEGGGMAGDSGRAGDVGTTEGTGKGGDSGKAADTDKAGNIDKDKDPNKTADTDKTGNIDKNEDPNKTADTDKTGNIDKNEDSGKGGDAGTAEGTGKSGEPNGDSGRTEQSGKAKAIGLQAISATSSGGAATKPSSYTQTSTISTGPATAGTQIAPTTITSAGIMPVTSTSTGASPSPGSVSDIGRTPSPGESVPGTRPGATAQPTTSTPSRVGTTGTAGYAGMLPPRAGGRRDEDGEHKSATYLRTEEHGEELIGEAEKTVPPVLGAQ